GAMVEEYCREGKSGLLDEAEAHFQRPLIRQVLMKTGWNQLKAAEILGINRNTLRTRIETLAIHKPADEG
ncbi:MAG: two component signal transduction response regulator, partial [Deltaproteobacteria bacterium]|nr:two component signal transduction response regulator [Deltaproteobacteria bacterium]